MITESTKFPYKIFEFSMSDSENTLICRRCFRTSTALFAQELYNKIIIADLLN